MLAESVSQQPGHGFVGVFVAFLRKPFHADQADSLAELWEGEAFDTFLGGFGEDDVQVARRDEVAVQQRRGAGDQLHPVGLVQDLFEAPLVEQASQRLFGVLVQLQLGDRVLLHPLRCSSRRRLSGHSVAFCFLETFACFLLPGLLCGQGGLLFALASALYSCRVACSRSFCSEDLLFGFFFLGRDAGSLVEVELLLSHLPLDLGLLDAVCSPGHRLHACLRVFLCLVGQQLLFRPLGLLLRLLHLGQVSFAPLHSLDTSQSPEFGFD
mmetsp:Transcript_27176/g.53443  ORF Transcript_27176/g.53443 Transcript_27176/m.53443 type:complete len:268 (+) Transcript_27176:1655-2458(+)